MKLKLFIAVFLLTGLITLQPARSYGQMSDILKGIGETIKGGEVEDIQKTIKGEELSESKIIEGLREALRIGTGNAVTNVSQVDGYFKNPKIQIPLPENVQKVEKFLRTVGYGPKVDAFELSMNRAAERAAPEAKSLFIDSIKEMTISDGRKILDGQENEATLYFEDKTRGRLYELFRPIVNTAMSEVGVTRSYQEIDKKARTIPFGEKFTLDLDDYVTNKGLDGLFFMVAEEEKKIRQNPTARVTDLLQEVFGSASR
jgi:hypothetical protein